MDLQLSKITSRGVNSTPLLDAKTQPLETQNQIQEPKIGSQMRKFNS